MLHLALSGNIVRALGGLYPLYNQDFIPKYHSQTELLYNKISLDLGRADKFMLDTFIKVSLWCAVVVVSYSS